MPKIWTKDEIIQVIHNEIRATYEDSKFRLRRNPTYKEVAELVFCALDEHNLIQYEP